MPRTLKCSLFRASASCSAIVFLLLVAMPARAQYTETVLHTFTGQADGGGPVGGLTLDSKGNAYGTTPSGGNTSDCDSEGCGVVFELSPPASGSGPWTETVLYTFSGSDGSMPESNLLFDANGNLYGTTSFGGNCGGEGCGVVFELSPPAGGSGTWTESVLHYFTAGTDGAYPWGLAFDRKGNLYGAAFHGGDTACSSGCGVVFELSPPASGTGSWTETTLYAFAGASDGYYPETTLVFDASGNLYGTASYGGNMSDCNAAGCGVVFELTPPASGSGAWTETVLYAFAGESDGYYPSGGLVFDNNRNLYGTTYAGGSGSPCGCGIVFELSPPAGGTGPWTKTVLHAFTGGSDGSSPATASSLLLDAEGNLYGSGQWGGARGGGVAFELSPPVGSGAWTETVLHDFSDGIDGGFIDAGLTFGPSGSFFGTAHWGGTGGVAYELIPLTGTVATSTTLTVVPATVVVGSTGPVVMTAVVAPTSGSGTPTGTVAFFNDLPEFANVTLAGGVAAFDFDPALLTAGEAYTITAAYSGDDTFAGSASLPQTLMVTGTTASTTALALAPSSVTAGSAGPVVMTATVPAVTGSPTPTGAVTFFNGSQSVGSAPMSSGTAQYEYNPSSLSLGTYQITAIYSGDSNYETSTSPAQALNVNAAADFTISASPTAITVSAPGGSGQTTITITPSGGFSQTITFSGQSCSGYPLGVTCSFSPGSVTPNGGAASTTVTISTTAATAAARVRSRRRQPGFLAAVFLPGLALLGRRRRKRAWAAGLCLALLLFGLALLSLGGCSSSSSGGGGGSGTGGTPTGTYAILVTANAAGLTHSTTVSLTVQ
jgi:uncharacterized repeat protein (TIGR03803 family)